MSAYKGFEFLSKKTELQTVKNEAFKVLVQSHEGLVRSLDAQISALDSELSNLSITDKLWKSKEKVRMLKASDRRVVMINFTETLLSVGKEDDHNEKP